MVKITDVARHAGVSPSTVSYVLSGKRSISEQTRRRVEESIRKLGYRPHAGARALASNRSNVLALVIPLRTGIHVPVVMQFAVSVVTTAREHDHDVLLLTQATRRRAAHGETRRARGSRPDAAATAADQARDHRGPDRAGPKGIVRNRKEEWISWSSLRHERIASISFEKTDFNRGQSQIEHGGWA